MRKFYLLSALVLNLFFGAVSYAQDFSNKGKEFYLCFPNHVPTGNNTLATLSIFITSDRASSGTITMPNGAFSSTFDIPAYGLQEIQIPWNVNIHISNGESNTIIQKSIKIKTDPGKPAVVAYAQQWAGARSAATLLLPLTVLGKNYRAISFTQNGSNTGSYLARSQFQIIAVKDNTIVDITPFKNGVKGTKVTVTFPLAGDMYQYQSTDAAAASQDLTGTYIESKPSVSGGCNPIAVFSGSSNITMGTAVPNCNGGSYDPLWQQLYPITTWGKNFGLVPFADDPNGVPYRIMASEDNTNVYINGALVANLNMGNIYPVAFTSSPATLTTPTSITADKPVCVTEYAQAQNCMNNGINVGDPDMVILNPIEQNIQDITVFSSTKQAITRQWVNVLLQTIAVPSFKISKNGGPLLPPVAAWQPFTNLPGYSYLKESLIGVSSARLVADSGFNAIAYGFGNVESYSYSAGTNVKDLYQHIGVITDNGIDPDPTVCTGAPFKFKVSLPYCADSIQWDLSNMPGPPPQPPLIHYTACVPGPGGPDSTTIVNGKIIYWYSLPTSYTVNLVGVYTINIIVYSPNSDGCGSEQDIPFDLNVYDPPFGSFTWTNNGCSTQPVQFTETTPQVPKTTYHFWWDFGDPASGAANNSALRNPSHLFTGPGTYTVRYAAITTPGCLTDTISHQIVLSDPPLAHFTVSTPDCVGVPLTFTDNSTVTGGGIINQWTWDFGDGSPIIIASTGASQPHTYAVAGIYTAHLTVQTSTGCQSLTFDFPVTIHVNPVADFSLPNVCLPVGAAQFNDLSTIVGAGESITNWAWDFGDAGVSNAQNPLHNYAGTGPYNVTLIATSNNGCSDTRVKTLTTIYAEPQAAFTWPPFVCLGNTASFTDNSTAPGSTVTQWHWDFGDASTSTQQNPTHTYAAAGVYTVTLNVTSAIGCQTVNNFATHTVTVNALPTATITGNTLVCLNSPSPNITFTGIGGLAPFTFIYSINGGPNQSVTTISGNSVTVAVPTNVVGTFTYSLVSVQEGSPVACSQPQAGSVTVTVSPLPTATISGTTAVCLNAPSPNITFTGAVGSAPYTFTYTINGGPNLNVTTVAGNSVTVAVPTNVAGTFTYTLVSVQEGGPGSCSQAQSGSSTVIVNPLPTASISGTTEVCLNATQPNITFTGAGGVAPYTFTYTINGGPNLNITTVVGNSVTIPVPTNVAGTFTYSLVRVQDGSATLCNQAQAGSATVIVDPLPTSNFTNTAPSCETRTINFTDISVANAGTIISWLWNFGDPPSGPANTSTLQNPSHTFSTAGTYNVSLIVTTDKGCVSIVPARQVVIHVRPKAGFIIPEVCINDIAAVFTDTSSITAGTFDPAGYVWDFGDGSPRTFTQNGTHLYLATGVYQVTHIVTSSFGCKDTLVQSITINGANPVGNFTVANPATLCANDSVSITNLSTVNFGNVTKLDIYWDFINQPAVVQVDDFPFFGKVYEHLYPNFQAPPTRSYTIHIRAYSGTLCFSDFSQVITVNAAPKVQFNNIPNTCLNVAPFQITQASEIGGVTGTGVFSGPGVSPTGIFNPALVGPGTYTIKYTFTSSAAGCVDTLSKTITVLAPPVADFSFAAPYCESQAITFTDNSTTPVGSLTTWTWDFGDLTPPVIRNNGTPFTHTFPGWGVYAVKLKVTTSDGCISTQKVINVTVNPQPKPNFSIPVSACLPNASVSFGNLSTIADGTQASFTYLWNFGDPASGAANISVLANPSHVYNSMGPFSVNLQITSGNGCVHDTTIIFNNLHPQPQASFTADKTDVCIGGSFVFNNTSNPLDGSITQYNWTMDDGNIRSIPGFTYTYSTVGTYNVSLFIFNSNGCRSNTYSQTVFVNPYPVVDAGPDKFMLQGGQVTLTPVVNASLPVTFLWTPPLYLSDPTIAFTIASPPDDMTYQLKETTVKGCSDSDKVFIKVLKAPSIPNIFSPNGDGIHDRWEIAYLESYPGATVDIFNRYGQLVYHSVGYSNPWDGKVNGKDVPVGTYYYIVDPKNGRAKMSGYVDVIR